MKSLAYVPASLLLALTLVVAACNKPAESAVSNTPTAEGTSNLSIADCLAIPDPQPLDESAAARATAASQGVAARQACNRQAATKSSSSSDDLARIREIKEQELAARSREAQLQKKWNEDAAKAAAQPRIDIKY